MTLSPSPTPRPHGGHLSGDVDITEKPPPAELATLSKVKGIELIGYQTPHAFFFIIDVQTPPMDDLRVRKAIRPRHRLERNRRGRGRRTLHPLQWVDLARLPGHNPNLQPFEYSPEKSKQFLGRRGRQQPQDQGLGARRPLLPGQGAGRGRGDYLIESGFDAELVVQDWTQQLDCLYTDYGICPGGLFLMGGSTTRATT